jgi:hypothetical protein
VRALSVERHVLGEIEATVALPFAVGHAPRASRPAIRDFRSVFVRTADVRAAERRRVYWLTVVVSQETVTLEVHRHGRTPVT